MRGLYDWPLHAGALENATRRRRGPACRLPARDDPDEFQLLATGGSRGDRAQRLAAGHEAPVGADLARAHPPASSSEGRRFHTGVCCPVGGREGWAIYGGE